MSRTDHLCSDSTVCSETGVIRIHQCISGFTQTEERPTGMFRLCERLHGLGFNNCVSRVRLDRWNANWNAVAEHLWLLGQHHRSHVAVNIYAYSWGVGWGAVQLARELQKRSIEVHDLVACDGVYRHRWLRLPAMLGRDSVLAPTIRVPANVLSVTPFHQTLNRPQGHHIAGDRDFSGLILESTELHATHQYMDDHEKFHAAAIHAARRLQKVT